MPTVHLLHDVQPVALTLCKKGANRQRVFLLKSAEGEKNLLPLPGGQRLLKNADWSVAYFVVAEPGKREDPGQGDGAGSGVDDEWKDAEEIRKAAHFFAKSDQLVTGLHGTVEPYGKVVENAVALADIQIVDPTGVVQTIRKGSWYVGIEPSAAGKQAIDAGEFTGISLEGTGYREAVELAKSVTDEDKRTIWQRLAQIVGMTPDSPPGDSGTVKREGAPEEENDDVADDAKITELDSKVQDIAKAQGAATTAIEGLIGTVNALVERLDKKNKEEGEKKDEVKPEDLKKSLDDLTSTFAEKLDELEGQLDKLADSGSSQGSAGDKIEKSSRTDDEALASIL